MKIVKFNDGLYGIRKFSFLTLCYVYYDFDCDGVWWTRFSHYFRRGDCHSSLEKAKKALYRLSDKGTPVTDKL